MVIYASLPPICAPPGCKWLMVAAGNSRIAPARLAAMIMEMARNNEQKWSGLMLRATTAA
jgi:hypothetical protein